jgi:hypothetical protein
MVDKRNLKMVGDWEGEGLGWLTVMGYRTEVSTKMGKP